MKKYLDKDGLRDYTQKITQKYKTMFSSPLIATTAAQMTETTKVYVYMGSESGYINGNWYFYNGTNWESGGVYNAVAVETDTTLTQSGKAADAKATGDAILNLKSEVFDEKLQITDMIQGGVRTNGDFVAQTKTLRSRDLIAVKKGDVLKIEIGTICNSAAIFMLSEDKTAHQNVGYYAASYAYIVPYDGYILPLFRKNAGEDDILPEEYDAQSTIFYKNNINSEIANLDNVSSINRKMSEIYERKEISASNNTYTIYTAENVTRARIKQEYIQKVPEGVTTAMVFLDGASLANKYSCLFTFFDENYRQLTSTSTGWKTATESMVRAVPATAKYFMFYFKTLDGVSEINLDEIKMELNSIMFDTNDGYIDYAKEMLKPHVVSLYPELKDGIDNLSSIRNEPFIFSINHRGYSKDAPENTLPAYILSRKRGFDWVEADIEFTSDGVAVLMHDATINRTGRNADGTAISETIPISSITYEQLQTYDFGIWKGVKWAGTKCPTLEEYLTTCKYLSLNTCLDIKDGLTQAQLQTIIDTVQLMGMEEHVIYGAFSYNHLNYIKTADPTATMGWGIQGTLTQTRLDEIITNVKALRTDTNTVMISVNYSIMTENYYNQLASEKIPVCIWTINSLTDIQNINKTVNAVMSDYLNAGNVLMQTLFDSLP